MSDGYAIIPNAFDKKLSLELKEFAQVQTNFQSAKISSSLNAHRDTTKRSDTTLWINKDSSIQSQYLSCMQTLQETLNKELYMGIQYYESHFAIYDVGDFYEKHLDTFKGKKNRVVTTVYYLNEKWNEEDSGELIIYDSSNNIIEKVIPQTNTLVVFLSDKFPHEVKPSLKKRYSIAGWFRSN